MYTLVDKNFTIPDIIKSNNLVELLVEFSKRVWKRDETYYLNIYIIMNTKSNMYQGKIIYSKNKFLLIDNENNIKEYPFDNSFIFNSNEQTINQSVNQSVNQIDKFDIVDTIDTDNKKDMELIINKKEPINIIVNNDKTPINIKMEKTPIKNELKSELEKEELEKEVSEEDKIKEQKKVELLKMCEQVMDLYNLELNNLKKQELNLKNLNNKIEKLEKKKKERIFDSISRTQNEYHTWKKIKYNIPKDNLEMVKNDIEELEIRKEIKIPILFQAKYDYIEKLNNNIHIKKIFDTLNKLDLEELYIKDKIDLDETVIKFVEKYYDLSKNDLHYKFEHDWDHMDNEFYDKGNDISLFVNDD